MSLLPSTNLDTSYRIRRIRQVSSPTPGARKNSTEGIRIGHYEFIRILTRRPQTSNYDSDTCTRERHDIYRQDQLFQCLQHLIKFPSSQIRDTGKYYKWYAVSTIPFPHVTTSKEPPLLISSYTSARGRFTTHFPVAPDIGGRGP